MYEFDDTEFMGMKRIGHVAVNQTTGINLGSHSITTTTINGTIQVNTVDAPAPQELWIYAVPDLEAMYFVGFGTGTFQSGNSWTWSMRIDNAYVNQTILFIAEYEHEDFGYSMEEAGEHFVTNTGSINLGTVTFIEFGGNDGPGDGNGEGNGPDW
jgi:hypothetical protein